MIGRRDSLAARVERIEARLAEPPSSDLPLSRHELAELLRLKRERDERFPVEVEDMNEAMLDEYMHYQAGADGTAARLAHLRSRMRTPEQRAEDRAMAIAIGSMDAAQLDDFMDAMNSGQIGDEPWRPS